MSKISNLIFNGASHGITSPYGKRAVIVTSAGNTSSFHRGTDYASKTSVKELPQYAIEDGYVFVSAKATDGANYVWVIYPRVKLAMLHYHLKVRNVKTGQKVSKGTKLGLTGMTGKATGVHLHLGIRDLNKLTNAQVNAMTWDRLQSCPYVDPEKVAYSEFKNPYKEPNYTLTRAKFEYGKIKVGDEGVKWLQYILKNKGYYNDSVDGFFGKMTESAVKNFQKLNKDNNGKQLEVDGSVGALTRGALKR